MTNSYQEFLKQKEETVRMSGLTGITIDRLHPVLFPFQKAVTELALRKGRFLAALDIGLGKTFIQLEYMRQIDKPSIIVAPLWVVRQTQRHAQKFFDLDLVYSKTDIGAKFVITNYENIYNFKFSDRQVVILDESSIIKGETSKYREYLTPACKDVRFKLCLSATQSPNNKAEFMWPSDFLGVMSASEVKSRFFINRTTNTAKRQGKAGWQLAGWAEEEFYKWLASWAIFMRLPSDLGFSDDGYDLPPANIDLVWVKTNYQPEGKLMCTGIGGVGGRTKIRAQTTQEKVEALAQDVNASNEQWLVWRRLIKESNMLAKALDDSREVLGRHSDEYKLQAIDDYCDGKIKVLIADPKMFGLGVNLQHSWNQAWCGINDSAETLYQGIGRQVRFGQEHQVNVRIYLSELEDVIWSNVKNKLEEEIVKTRKRMINATAKYSKLQMQGEEYTMSEYIVRKEKGDGWELWNGDSCELMTQIPDNSIDLSVSSPPFLDLYAYNGTTRDLSNARNTDEFFKHFEFIARQWLRITKPGRVLAMHVMDVPAMLGRDGYIGLKDFSGDCIKLFESVGWILADRIPVDKNQQAQSIRTRAKSLSMTQKDKDSVWISPAQPDYVLKFRKPGENAVPVTNSLDNETWIVYASPTWPGSELEGMLENKYGNLLDILKLLQDVTNDLTIGGNMLNLSNVLADVSYARTGIFDIVRDIEEFVLTNDENVKRKSDGAPKVLRQSSVVLPNSGVDRCLLSTPGTWFGIYETDTLQFDDKTKGHFALSRDERDKKHVCPLQLSLIERCIKMWSNEGEKVFDPFAGIGSTPYQAVRYNRRGFGIELKNTYFDVAVRNMKLTQKRQLDMFQMLGGMNGQ